MKSALKDKPEKERLERFNKKVMDQRIPLSGSLDLTHQCNLQCVHCYIGDKSNISGNGLKELDTSQWISIINEVAEAGCLNLLITGGEPLLRKDFSQIYSHAKSKGMLVTVFTNGTLITEEILSLFKRLPPRCVEISLYGATAATYEKVTGIKGSYKKCLTGIQCLLNQKTNLKLKTILMSINAHEFDAIEKMAYTYGTEFRFDAAISACINGDRSPVDFRVSPEMAIEKEFSDKKRSRQWKDYFKRNEGLTASNFLYNCGSGLTGFHIDPYGRLQPCLMVTDLRYDLKKGTFMKGWNDVISQLRKKKINADHTCKSCKKITLCGFCPAFFRLESGSEEISSGYLCAIGQSRFNAIQSIST